MADPQTRSPDDVTLSSYDAAVEEYVRASRAPRDRIAAFLDDFARELGGPGTVLELGSGPGWDADHLEGRGLTVIRTDGALGFVDRLHGQGHAARLLDVRADDWGGPYDGVLANAVLLHLSRAEFAPALRRARQAVRLDGRLGLTLKEGDGEDWTEEKLGSPRHFTFWREPALRAELSAAGWQVLSLEHVPGRADDWLYVLARPKLSV